MSPAATKTEVLEFFSGVGGLHFAFKQALKELEEEEEDETTATSSSTLPFTSRSGFRVQSFDLSTVANSVYAHNFPNDPPTYHRDLCLIYTDALDQYDADVWLLSPPCQPYTRQGRKKDVEDVRAKPLLALCQRITDMKRPPSYLLLENVKGFDESQSRKILMRALLSRGYHVREFLLSPQDFGIPNSRLRYFCLAKLSTEQRRFYEDGVGSSSVVEEDQRSIAETIEKPVIRTRIPGSSHFISASKVVPTTSLHHSSPSSSASTTGDGLSTTSPLLSCQPIKSYIDPNTSTEELKKLEIPETLLQSHGYVLDIVTPNSTRSCCFTKAYTHYAEGTGSVLQTVESIPPPSNSSPANPSNDNKEWNWETLKELRLRYFSPREVANLHHFPPEFTFPPSVSPKKQYQLLGNSLNVGVVCELIKYLLKDGKDKRSSSSSHGVASHSISSTSHSFSQSGAGSDVLILEAFYGGSHRQLVDTLMREIVPRAQLYTLPAKKWQWRLRTAAMHFAEVVPRGREFRLIFASSTLNMAEFLALRPDLASARKVIYFHENQLCYPVREQKERDFQHAWAQIMSGLVCDELVFNSGFNRDSFLNSIQPYINKYVPVESRVGGIAEKLRPKSKVLYFPVSDSPFVASSSSSSSSSTGASVDNKETSGPMKPLRILWNHRWEFDKNPDLFFETLFHMKEKKLKFELSVLGEQYIEKPDIFQKAHEVLRDHIVHWGFVESREEYERAVREADVVVSTSDHEFYGVSVIEGIMAGCMPICPNKLVYPELIPKKFLYSTPQQLFKQLKKATYPDFLRPHRERARKPYVDITPYTWETLKSSYSTLLLDK